MIGGGSFRRSADLAREKAGSLWGDVLSSISPPEEGPAGARICFNLGNPLVRRLTGVEEAGVARLAVELLYVHAMLLGHHPLRAAETRLLNEGLLRVIDLGMRGAAGEAPPG